MNKPRIRPFEILKASAAGANRRREFSGNGAAGWARDWPWHSIGRRKLMADDNPAQSQTRGLAPCQPYGKAPPAWFSFYAAPPASANLLDYKPSDQAHMAQHSIRRKGRACFSAAGGTAWLALGPGAQYGFEGKWMRTWLPHLAARRRRGRSCIDWWPGPRPRPATSCETGFVIAGFRSMGAGFHMPGEPDR